MNNLVGDVSSAARILPDLHGERLFIRSAGGAYLHDDRGRRYIDTALGFGAVLLGHSRPDVVSSVGQALLDGASPSWAHVREHAAAASLARFTGDMCKVMFTNSGSEAVHLACRAARAFTGRRKIAKMAAGFDGWFDEVSFGNVSSPEAGFADGARPSTERTTLLRFNDFEDVERLFREDDDIAAIVMEPMLANAGCLMAAPGYLLHVQQVARRHGALLIADEVLMGFRLFAGLASLREGLTPDLATVGKAIGSGVPVSAVVGRPEVLAGFERGTVTRGGTFSGNPMACAALLTTLEALRGSDYTARRQPVTFAWCEDFPSRLEAIEAERRIKGWSRAKKEALIAGDWDRVSQLAVAYGARPSTSSGRTEEGVTASDRSSDCESPGATPLVHIDVVQGQAPQTEAPPCR